MNKMWNTINQFMASCLWIPPVWGVCHQSHFRLYLSLPESKLFPKVYPQLLNTDVKSVLGGPCQTVEAHRMSFVRNILVLLPCLSTSAYILSTGGWAQQLPGWPNISLGTSLLSWGELFFFLACLLKAVHQRKWSLL